MQHNFFYSWECFLVTPGLLNLKQVQPFANTIDNDVIMMGSTRTLISDNAMQHGSVNFNGQYLCCAWLSAGTEVTSDEWHESEATQRCHRPWCDGGSVL